jgi:hypothetical protein
MVPLVIFAMVRLCAADEPVVIFDAGDIEAHRYADDGCCPVYRFAPLPR